MPETEVVAGQSRPEGEPSGLVDSARLSGTGGPLVTRARSSWSRASLHGHGRGVPGGGARVAAPARRPAVVGDRPQSVPKSRVGFRRIAQTRTARKKILLVAEGMRSRSPSFRA